MKIVSETLETIAYSTITKDDSSQYEGTSTVTQEGENGYKVQTYRQIYDSDGNLLSEEKEAYSVYSKHDEIIYVGTKKKKTTTTKSSTSSSSSTTTTDDSTTDTTSSDSTSDSASTTTTTTDDTTTSTTATTTD
ncbi:MAG: G5 domain-containing protein [Clostridiales bacterium]|nr:G5 domain-containing protein [Clostridiales bacterium]